MDKIALKRSRERNVYLTEDLTVDLTDEEKKDGPSVETVDAQNWMPKLWMKKAGTPKTVDVSTQTDTAAFDVREFSKAISVEKEREIAAKRLQEKEE